MKINNDTSSALLMLKDLDPIAEKYSKVSRNLDRVYQNYTIEKVKEKLSKKNVVIEDKRLKNVKSADKYLEEISNYKKLPTITQDKFLNSNKKYDPLNPPSPKNFQNHNENEEDKNEREKIEAFEYYNKVKQEKIMRKRREKNGISPEPGHYNPLYNSIYSKVSVPKIMPDKKMINIREKKGILNISQKHQNVTTTSVNYGSDNNYSFAHDKNTTFFTSKRGIKFDLYCPRKNYENEKGSKILSYLEPLNYSEALSPKNKSSSQNTKIKGFNMDKTKGRDISPLINSNNYPSPGDYNPKWEITKQNNSSMLYFHQNKDPQNSKKFIMRKILCSFNPTSDFKMVQLKNLIENKKKATKLVR